MKDEKSQYSEWDVKVYEDFKECLRDHYYTPCATENRYVGRVQIINNEQSEEMWSIQVELYFIFEAWYTCGEELQNIWGTVYLL